MQHRFAVHGLQRRFVGHGLRMVRFFHTNYRAYEQPQPQPQPSQRDEIALEVKLKFEKEMLSRRLEEMARIEEQRKRHLDRISQLQSQISNIEHTTTSSEQNDLQLFALQTELSLWTREFSRFSTVAFTSTSLGPEQQQPENHKEEKKEKGKDKRKLFEKLGVKVTATVISTMILAIGLYLRDTFDSKKSFEEETPWRGLRRKPAGQVIPRVDDIQFIKTFVDNSGPKSMVLVTGPKSSGTSTLVESILDSKEYEVCHVDLRMGQRTDQVDLSVEEFNQIIAGAFGINEYYNSLKDKNFNLLIHAIEDKMEREAEATNPSVIGSFRALFASRRKQTKKRIVLIDNSHVILPLVYNKNTRSLIVRFLDACIQFPKCGVVMICGDGFISSFFEEAGLTEYSTILTVNDLSLEQTEHLLDQHLTLTQKETLVNHFGKSYVPYLYQQVGGRMPQLASICKAADPTKALKKWCLEVQALIKLGADPTLSMVSSQMTPQWTPKIAELVFSTLIQRVSPNLVESVRIDPQRTFVGSGLGPSSLGADSGIDLDELPRLGVQAEWVQSMAMHNLVYFDPSVRRVTIPSRLLFQLLHKYPLLWQKRDMVFKVVHPSNGTKKKVTVENPSLTELKSAISGSLSIGEVRSVVVVEDEATGDLVELEKDNELLDVELHQQTMMVNMKHPGQQ